MLAWWACACVAFALRGAPTTPSLPWVRVSGTPPADPTRSCYPAPDDNATWYCAPDALLVEDVDGDDSY